MRGRAGRARLLIVASCIAGMIVLLSLVAWAGLGQIVSALDRIGWGGLAWICLLQLPVMALCAAGWWCVSLRASYGACLMARWIRDGATNLAAMVPAFGEAIGARVLALLGLSGGTAGASIVLDIAAETLAQALYALMGLIPLSFYVSREDMMRWAGIAVGAATPVLILFWSVRYRGALRLAQWAETQLASLFGLRDEAGSRSILQPLREIYGQRQRVSAAFLFHVMAWIAGAIQIWAAAHQLERPLGLGAALAVDSLVQAARAAFFIVPWAAGVQEGALVLAGAAVGLDAPSALAISLVLRARDLVLGAPAILAWGVLEWWHAARDDRPAEAGEQSLPAKVIKRLRH
ncbi:lysylphosphatidylglycerol synthase domain-containing protein [Microvirga sp. 2TAF3]|uniref:lysylphosphatidylglycerol synthase domain-containing protein n=1 Tax=Microvirga sp. 2TAF3 TaxID=3233014 RepID=UPI003F98826D